MNESDFEGTLVLEKLVELGKLEAFMEAIDADDFVKAKRLMRLAGIGQVTINRVLQMMEEAD